ncbi:phosphohexomutase domain-containing protein [Streptomyces beihaiensis]|uniref:Phosphomannomutase/phosphoglucomutase n=1 Tax=Streptomyces beihaiensis TaxID=2984495 RepID=A0ABT3TQ97_9ACTN|nr:phosphomannomutase/phosphoglucomutase [Streptomyces beihaiensis]MCX3058681.1 phosphomannomutase/phosphoglucomutase [Streptomyces beihaiensis]
MPEPAGTPGTDLYDRLVTARDIRGRYRDELDPGLAYRVGAAFTELTGADAVAVAHDMRESSPRLADALAQGVLDQGADVVDAGLGSTDYLHYVSGRMGIPGAMVTAGCAPAPYNGIRLCRRGAVAVAEGTGLDVLRRRLREPRPALTDRPGSVLPARDLDGYAEHLRALVDLTDIRPLKVVVDAGNGMAGLTAPLVLDHPSVELVPLHLDLDGTFPHRPADPRAPDALAGLRERVQESGADLGLAFDGDGDGCVAVDERGHPVPPGAVIALVAGRELARRPGAAVVHDLITPTPAIEAIKEAGGIPVRSRTGPEAIKSLMAEQDAAFGGAHCGRCYFRDFWYADTGMLTALHLLAELGGSGRELSELVARHDRYVSSGAVDVPVPDAAAALRRVAHHFASRGAELDHLDGVSGEFTDGTWFNVRTCDTRDPSPAAAVRVHVEAGTVAAMERLRDGVVGVVSAGR